MKRSWVEAQRDLVIAVAGVKAMGSDLTRIREGFEVELRPEPENPYDPNAVQVVAWYSQAKNECGHVLGYISREWAAVLNPEQWTAIVQSVLVFEGHPAGLRLHLRRREMAE